MKQAGQIALTPFPHTDLSGSKLRPVLLLRKASQRFDDWLVCMVSSQLDQAEAGLDEFLLPEQPDFMTTGLKVPSLLRLSRLAVLDGGLLKGAIGAIDPDRLTQIRQRLGQWLAEEIKK